MTEDLVTLKQLLADATTAPWRSAGRFLMKSEPQDGADFEIGATYRNADAALTAAARNSLPELIVRMERLEARIELARLAARDTSSSWQTRCARIMEALSPVE